MKTVPVQSSYKSIVKSTSLVGGAQVIKIAFRIVRSKVLAVLLGPAGFGLIGALTSSLELVQSISGLGIGNSAVRDIAKAEAEGDTIVISKTILTLRRVTWILGFAGMIAAMVLAAPLSKFTFETYEYTSEIRFLSVIIFFNLIALSQSALLQGKRRIKDLAKLNVLGALYGTILSIPLVYFYGTNGIVPFLIIVSLAQLLTSWWFARKIKVQKARMTMKEVWIQSQGMIKLGLAFMAGGFTTVAATYLIRVMIIRSMDLSAAGIYQAAMALSTLYIGIILDAMGKDFYPRLTAVINDNENSIRIINEQTEVGMLLAAPGLLFTLALAPLVIRLLYSSEFLQSYQILQWMIMGIFLRVLSWPMGYVFVAKGKGNMFLMIQVVANIIHLIFVFLFVRLLGLWGTGLAFLVLYLVHTIFLRLLAAKEICFKWNQDTIQLMLLFSLIFVLSLIFSMILSQLWSGIIISALAVGIALFSLVRLTKMLGFRNIVELIQNFSRRIGRKHV